MGLNPAPTRSARRLALHRLKPRLRLVGGGVGGGLGGGAVEVEDAVDELAQSAAEMAENALLQRGVVLRATEQIGEQLAEDGVALEKLHHAGGDGRAEE